MKFFTAFIVLFTFIQINAQIQPKEKFPTASSDSSFFDSFLFDVNKLILPLNNEGVIGDVLIQGEAGGRYDGFGFLYSGGFFLSGKDGDSIWTNAVASASRLQDYLPGKVGESPLDQIFKLYSVRSADPHFGDSWNDWKDAVELGADFYNGDGDGEYNPIDLNGNGVWDLNEDAPGIIGDLTAWTVYNDAVPPELRRFNDVEAKGIEIQQTIFANSGSNKQIENIVFIRYRLINTGIVNTVFDSVYFSAWSDPDVGNYQTDLAGSDTLHSSGFIYKDSADALYGINPPAFFKTFLQGPPVYIAGETFIDVNSNGIFDEGIDTPVTNAKNNKGLFLGSEIIPGAKNIGLASVVHYISSHSEQGDPSTKSHARNYLQGKNKFGDYIDPCTWAFGGFFDGTDCNDVNPVFIYSGDPVNNSGWINTFPTDQRLMVNTGPFALHQEKPIDVITSYVIGRGTDHFNSIEIARNNVEYAKAYYDNNFTFLPPVGIDDLIIANKFILRQNYPNPFNPKTKIKFSIPLLSPPLQGGVAKPGWFVTLKIYDILGNEVAALLNEEKSPGEYEVIFNAANLSSGVYFYELKTGNFIQNKKMILLK